MYTKLDISPFNHFRVNFSRNERNAAGIDIKVVDSSIIFLLLCGVPLFFLFESRCIREGIVETETFILMGDSINEAGVAGKEEEEEEEGRIDWFIIMFLMLLMLLLVLLLLLGLFSFFNVSIFFVF